MCTKSYSTAQEAAQNENQQWQLLKSTLELTIQKITFSNRKLISATNTHKAAKLLNT